MCVLPSCQIDHGSELLAHLWLQGIGRSSCQPCGELKAFTVQWDEKPFATVFSALHMKLDNHHREEKYWKHESIIKIAAQALESLFDVHLPQLTTSSHASCMPVASTPSYPTVKVTWILVKTLVSPCSHQNSCCIAAGSSFHSDGFCEKSFDPSLSRIPRFCPNPPFLANNCPIFYPHLNSLCHHKESDPNPPRKSRRLHTHTQPPSLCVLLVLFVHPRWRELQVSLTRLSQLSGWCSAIATEEDVHVARQPGESPRFSWKQMKIWGSHVGSHVVFQVCL